VIYYFFFSEKSVESGCHFAARCAARAHQPKNLICTPRGCEKLWLIENKVALFVLCFAVYRNVAYGWQCQGS
jgi:hypothetical protein